MREFKVGDVVTIEKPRDKQEFPYWTEEMDRFSGLRVTISGLTKQGEASLFQAAEAPGYDFLQSWANPLITSDPINHPDHYAGSNGLTGGLTNYYLSRVEYPQREDQPAYTAECEDLIESLRLDPDEANIFKEIWRSANARLGNGKPDHKALYGAEKMHHYSGRKLRRLQREAQK